MHYSIRNNQLKVIMVTVFCMGMIMLTTIPVIENMRCDNKNYGRDQQQIMIA